MAKFRSIQTDFWQDDFTLILTPEEKYFYIYLMTNTKSNQLGCYVLPKKVIEMETGYNRETIEKLLDRFVEYEKILYSEETNEILILNWYKYNWLRSENTKKCIMKEFESVKNPYFAKVLQDLFKQFGYVEDIPLTSPLQALCIPLPSNKKEKEKEKLKRNNIYIGEQAHRHDDQSEIDSAVENNNDSLKDKSYAVSNNEDSKSKSCTECKAVIDYLNQKLGSNYRTSTKATQRHIKARLNEGFKFDDFKAVIDVKYAEWKNTEFERFLRPITLFGTKFETYLNQTSKKSFVDDFDEKCKEIIDYLNKVSGYSYRHDSTQTRELINDLLVEGFKVDDFKVVIDHKKREWKGTEWESYIRPKTLFKKNKFEDYLNEGLLREKERKSSNGFTEEEKKAYIEQLRKENEEFEKKRKLEKRKNA